MASERESARTFRDPGMNWGNRRMERDSVQRKISWARELRNGDLVPPSLRRYDTAVELSQKTDTFFPTREERKWRRPSLMARSSRALMDREAWSGSQRPEAVRELRWAPQPTSEASDQKSRSGDTWARDTLWDRRGRSSHHWRSLRQSGDQGILTDWSSRSQDLWRQCWRDLTQSRPPGTRWEREDSMPSSESQVLAGGSAQDRNASAVDRSLATRSGNGEARKDCESITTLRYWTTWEGTRCDFSGFTTILSSRQRSRTTWRSRRRLARGWLDKPVVEVPPHADTPRMENGGNRSHDPWEDLWSRGEAEAKGRELVNIALSHKPKEAPRVRMDRDLQVGYLEVDGGHPATLMNRKKDRLDGLHAEVRHIHEQIENREIDDGSPRSWGLPHNE